MKTSVKAAPNETSGVNPNTPIRIYDTHPNQRFDLGDQVLKIDFEEPRVLGRVLGHIAEDRIWVQWPHTVSQEDVDDVISTREWAYGFLDDSDYRLQGKKRRAGREALMPRSWGGSGVPQWMGGAGSYQQQQQQQPSTYNPLRLPEVESFLENAGLARVDVQNFASQYDKALELKTQKQNVQWEKMLQGQQVQEGFQQPIEFGQQMALPWQMKQKAPAPGQVPLPSPAAPAPAPLPAFRDVPQQYAPTSASRRKGGQTLFRIANLLRGLGHRKAAQVIMATTDVVTALENLYKNKKTRKASQDKIARRAMGVAILATLGITEILRTSKKAGLKRAADDVDLALIQSLAYPRKAAGE